jgi:hypothetical protein
VKVSSWNSRESQRYIKRFPRFVMFIFNFRNDFFVAYANWKIAAIEEIPFQIQFAGQAP